MLHKITLSAAALAATAMTATLLEAPANARDSGSAELAPYLQCVPYARELSGVQIYGDAHTWWQQAAGKYKRGNAPRVGAVMAFQPHRNMSLGHVAAVSRIIDSRTVLLSHSNWSPIDGRRGQIEKNVKAIDVSPNNDWSEVRVWYHPIQALGKTAWPVHGFIYNERGDGRRDFAPTRVARAASAAPTDVAPARTRSSSAFLNAFAKLDAPAAAAATRPAQPRRVAVRQATWSQPVPVAQRSRSRGRDRLSAALAKYD